MSELALKVNLWIYVYLLFLTFKMKLNTCEVTVNRKISHTLINGTIEQNSYRVLVALSNIVKNVLSYNPI